MMSGRIPTSLSTKGIRPPASRTRLASILSMLESAGNDLDTPRHGGRVKTIARVALIATLATTTLAIARGAPLRQAPTIYAFTNVTVLAMDAERLVADQT